jgi:hypothetical protein
MRPLTQRLLRDQCQRIGRNIFTGSQPCVEPPLPDNDPELFEASGLGARELLSGVPAIGWAVPKRKSVSQQQSSFRQIPSGKSAIRTLDQPLEPVRIDEEKVGRLERVSATTPRHLSRCAKRLSNLGHVHLHQPACRRRRPLRPDRVNQPLVRNDMRGGSRQRSQQPPLLLRQRNHLSVAHQRHRAQHPHLNSHNRSIVARARSAGKAG